jgi:hypothetical protein
MSDWLTNSFGPFIKFAEETNRVLHISIKGIYQISQQMPLLKALDNLERVRAENAMKPFQPKDFQFAETETEFARQEIEKGFSLLYAHALVSIWSAMEALFEDVLVGHIIHEPEILKEDVFQKIKIPLATYEQLNQEDKARLLVNELQRSFNSGQRLGLGCFEALLRVIGLAGGVNAGIRRDTFELQQL